MPVTTAVPPDINAWAIGAVHTFQRRMVSLITADQQGRIWVSCLYHCGAPSAGNPEADLESSTWPHFCSPATHLGKKCDRPNRSD
ncbi:protein of unknown function [Azospirillum baldaniorum]|uniref:Uncharacterized protein n=1 Tax=Azospirillum baldaniorum TaxID=1064539 RepID=A0A9P1JST1_9PROT|nr:protein of unknown function [Azospirillum baldaniorum]